ncbi:MAG: hypothetical protein Q7T71_10495 [Herbiconiux sp.]|nr:hypothetical protein [Herbiconiux sp.]
MLDARYPVLALDASGAELQKRRTRVLPTPAAAPGASAARTPRVTADLVLRLRTAAAQAPDDATAWISRRLDQAVRARTPISIDVRMPDDSVTHYDVTPQSFANGRLRCVDVRAGVERTVPVANIVHLETA